MLWYQWLSLGALIICLISLLVHLNKLIRLGKPRDYSHQTGNIPDAVKYAYTGAMSPAKKETAFLHLPTYIAGLLYHLGTFLAFFLYLLLMLNLSFGTGVGIAFACMLFVSSISGLGILIKRLFSKKMRALSNGDDYLSNILTTLFQAMLALALIFPALMQGFYLAATLLFLYIPFGKLKHLLYFFAARYHLGFFFGRRNAWPPKPTPTKNS